MKLSGSRLIKRRKWVKSSVHESLGPCQKFFTPARQIGKRHIWNTPSNPSWWLWKITDVPANCFTLHIELKLILLLFSFLDKFELKTKLALVTKMAKNQKSKLKKYTACSHLCCFQVRVNNKSAIPSGACISDWSHCKELSLHLENLINSKMREPL